MDRTIFNLSPAPSPQTNPPMYDNPWNLPPAEISSLSNTQDIILSLTPIIPAILSIMGSSTIIYVVMKARKHSPYRRLLFALSVCDIVASLTVPLWSFLMPSETSQHIYAVGTDATCSLIGFSTQSVGFSSLLYNACLSYYFLLTVRYGMKERDFARRVEPYLHILAIGYPMMTAITGAALGVYHEMELGVGCWVTDWPEGCGYDDGTDGEYCHSVWIAILFGGTILLFLFVSLIANNILIYRYVRHTIQTGYRHGRNNTPGVLISENQKRRISAVATQAFLYVACACVTYTWTLMLRIMESLTFSASAEANIFVLLMAQAIFLPMQGFFNCCVYLRPKYIRIRNQYRKETRIWAIQRSIFGEVIVPTHSYQASTTHTMGMMGAAGAGAAAALGRHDDDDDDAAESSCSSGKFSAILFRSDSFRRNNNNNNNNNNTNHSNKSISRSIQLSMVSSLPSIIEERSSELFDTPSQKPKSLKEAFEQRKAQRQQRLMEYKMQDEIKNNDGDDDDNDNIHSNNLEKAIKNESTKDDARTSTTTSTADDVSIVQHIQPPTIYNNDKNNNDDENSKIQLQRNSKEENDSDDGDGDNDCDKTCFSALSSNFSASSATDSINDNEQEEEVEVFESNNIVVSNKDSNEITINSIKNHDNDATYNKQENDHQNTNHDDNDDTSSSSIAPELTDEWVQLQKNCQEQEALDQGLKRERKLSDELSEWSREFGVNDH